MEVLLNYITIITLKALLQDQLDSSVSVHHKYIINNLHDIVYALGKEITPYLNILVPCQSHYLKKSQNDNNLNTNQGELNLNILKLFEKIQKACMQSFGLSNPANVDYIIDMVIEHIKDPNQDGATCGKLSFFYISLFKEGCPLYK